MADIEANKAVARRYYEEVLTGGNVDALDHLAAEDYIEHDPFPGQGNGRADLKARVGYLLSAFSPLSFNIEDVIAEGDKVVVRWKNAGTHSGNFMGIPATSKQFSVAGVDIHVVRDGRLAEHWHVVDQFSQMQQLGLLPVPEGARA
ncbi:MAG: ester cyclase [Candidatus Dormibacteraeota bacterium]|nr:ester cyclase [Candidatus Dormibacteraeota bacterium]